MFKDLYYKIIFLFQNPIGFASNKKNYPFMVTFIIINFIILGTLEYILYSNLSNRISHFDNILHNLNLFLNFNILILIIMSLITIISNQFQTIKILFFQKKFKEKIITIIQYLLLFYILWEYAFIIIFLLSFMKGIITERLYIFLFEPKNYRLDINISNTEI